MTLIKTTKKHWANGYQVRGRGAFKSFALSLGNYAVMVCWGYACGYSYQFYFYKLLK